MYFEAPSDAHMVPGGHLVHSIAPCIATYLPFSHFRHAAFKLLCPVLVPYRPEGHSMHSVAFAVSLYVPA